MKALIHEIRAKVERRQYEYSKNAVDQSIIRDISVAEVEDAIAGRSEVIEDYPQDKYGPTASSLATRKLAGHCMFSAATREGRSSRSSLYTSLTQVCGSIFGSESEMKGNPG